MATISLEFNHFAGSANGDTGRIEYDTTNHVITFFTDLASGAYTPGRPIVGPSDVNDSVNYDWVVLWRKYENSNLYTVEARIATGSVEARATENPYTPFSVQVSQTDIDEYGRWTGAIELAISGGTGENISISWQSEVASGPLGTSEEALPAGVYTITLTDTGDNKTEVLEITLTQPPCNLLIDDIAQAAPSAPGESDGTITVNATSDNTLEYRLDSGAWQDSNLFSGLAEGSYNIQVREKDANLCTQSRNVSLNDEPCDVAITAVDILHESFSGEEDGQISVTATSSRPLEYRLDSGAWQDSPVFTNLSAKDYAVKVRAKTANQCQSSRFAFVEPGGNVEATITDILCGGSATGAISANISNPDTENENSPYTFLWANGSTSQNRTQIIAGTYSVTVTTANGRSKDFSFVVSENTPLTVAANVDNSDVFLTPNGGKAPYSYLWNDGNKNQNRSGLEVGLYSVTVTDANGCKKTQSIQVRLPQHYFTDNPVVLEVQAADHLQKENLSFVCECWIEEEYLSGTFTKIAEKEQPAFDGEAVFRWEDVLRSYVGSTLPEYSAAIKRLDNNFCRFYLKYSEKYGSPPTVSGFSQQEIFYIHLGGLSDEVFANNSFFSDYLPGTKPFYSWQPAEKVITMDAPEYLYFIMYEDDIPDFRVKAKLYYENEEEPTNPDTKEIELFTQSQVLQWELFSIPAGYDQLSIGGMDCRACFQYDIYVTKLSGELISEIRTFIVSTKRYLNKRFLYFLNSFGCFDTLIATGQAKSQMKVDEARADKILKHNFKNTDQRTEIIEKSGEAEVQIPVGYLSKDELERLQDFTLSSEYYLFERPAGYKERLTPITVEVNNASIYDESEYLQEFEFSFIHPKQKRFSPKLFTATSSLEIEALAQVFQAYDGLNNGEITLIVSGGLPPYSFAWSDGSTSQNRNDLAPGTYSVIIKDSGNPARYKALCGMIIENNDFLAWRVKESSAYCIKE